MTEYLMLEVYVKKKLDGKGEGRRRTNLGYFSWRCQEERKKRITNALTA